MVYVVSWNVAEPVVPSTPTPFSKKKPLPNESPTSLMLDIDAMKAPRSKVPAWPQRSDQFSGSRLTCSVIVPPEPPPVGENW